MFYNKTKKAAEWEPFCKAIYLSKKGISHLKTIAYFFLKLYCCTSNFIMSSKFYIKRKTHNPSVNEQMIFWLAILSKKIFLLNLLYNSLVWQSFVILQCLTFIILHKHFCCIKIANTKCCLFRSFYH